MSRARDNRRENIKAFRKWYGRKEGWRQFRRFVDHLESCRLGPAIRLSDLMRVKSDFSISAEGKPI